MVKNYKITVASWNYCGIITTFDSVSKSSIKESHATPTLFIQDQYAKMRKNCPAAKKFR